MYIQWYIIYERIIYFWTPDANNFLHFYTFQGRCAENRPLHTWIYSGGQKGELADIYGTSQSRDIFITLLYVSYQWHMWYMSLQCRICHLFYKSMMTSSNETFSALLALCAGRPVTRSFDVFLICAWINGRVNNREAGDFRHHRAHHDVTVMMSEPSLISNHISQGYQEELQ